MNSQKPLTFPLSEFEEWAGRYDDTVLQSRSFPFRGYTELLDTVVKIAKPAPGMQVLDLGSGTGNLALRFANANSHVWCTDFSPAMLEMAKVKIPGASFAVYDLLGPYPAIMPAGFDRIVSAYTFHHFQIEKKVDIIKELFSHLRPGGSITIGDISFPDSASLETARRKYKEDWDEEYYWIADSDARAIQIPGTEVKYRQVSDFLGVYLLMKKNQKRKNRLYFS